MSNPYMVKIPFCNAGNKNAIQLIQQAGQDPEDATYQEGFPPVTMLNEDAGGLPPKGLDFNGIFYELSSPIAHYCRGDRIQFDATYAAAIGGYAKGWIVASNDYQKDYISLVDNNLADPNGTNTTWAVYAGQGSVPAATSTTTGTVKLVNSLAITATDAALTAAQGKALKDIFDSFSFSATSSGYLDIPVGNRKFIIQWFSGQTTTVGDANFTINYPKAFPNACLHIMVSTKGEAANQTDGVFQERSFGRTSCVVNSQVFGTGSISAGITPKIIAIGY